jgi:hypothetical protein
MNRRRFLVETSVFAASAASSLPLLGCGDVTLEIPCIAASPAKPQSAAMTYLRASEIGCALDCDLATGRNKSRSGPATDDAPRINAALAPATKDHPITLIMDGGALVSGLFLPAGGYWSIVGQGCQTGFFVKSGTNNDGIHNGDATAGYPGDPGPPAPSRGRNVTLKDFVLNANAGNGRSGVSTTGAVQGKSTQWFVGINLMNLDEIEIENVVILQSPSYHIRLSNVGHVQVKGCIFRSLGPSTDGLHFNGPANDIAISGCKFITGDDAIALNCPEGYSGDIARVTVTDCTFDSWSLMRLDTIQTSDNAYKFDIDAVTVRNCTGKFKMAAFLLGQGAGSHRESIHSLSIFDCAFEAPAVLEIAANFGVVRLARVSLTPRNLHGEPGFAFARTSPYFYGCTYTGTLLEFENCLMEPSSQRAVAAVIPNYQSMIDTVRFNGFSWNKTATSHSTSPALIDFVSGDIRHLIIDALDSDRILQPVSSQGFGHIGVVSGAGVLSTGWEFPDTTMADGFPYISASTGRAAIKIDGTVNPYP